MLLDELTADQRFRMGLAVRQNATVSHLVRRAVEESMSAQEFAVVLAEHTVLAIEAAGGIAYDLALHVHSLKQPCLN